MAKVLLTSNGFYTDTIKSEFLDLLEAEPCLLKAVIVTSATLQKEHNSFAVKAHQDLWDMGFRKVDYIDIETECSKLLEQYDVIYINGGNPFYLLYHLKKSGADKVIKKIANQHVIIVGVSAGAMILGPNISIAQQFTPKMNTIELEDLSGLGITDRLIFPHYNREDLFPSTNGMTINDRIKLFEAKHNCFVSRINDDQFILILG